MHLVAGDERTEMLAELALRVGGNVVELVHGDQSVLELLDTELVRESEGRIGADQNPILAVEERAELTLPPFSDPGASQRFHFGATTQSAEKPYLDSGSSWKLAVSARCQYQMTSKSRRWVETAAAPSTVDLGWKIASIATSLG